MIGFAALVLAALFAGAALYIDLFEQPARMRSQWATACAALFVGP